MAGNARSSILVIEDDAHIRRMMQLLLEGEGYAVTVAASAAAGTLRARSAAPDLVLLDLGLPDASGMDLLSAEGALGGAPVIVVTAHGQEADKVRALDAGADDYVVKPFSNAELLARVRAALRRAQRAGAGAAAPAVLTFGELCVNSEQLTVTLGQQELHLTPHEFKLLEFLAQNRGKVLTHQAIQRQVWGYPTTDGYKTLRVLMASLRRKIGDSPSAPLYIKTEVGTGYRFIAE